MARIWGISHKARAFDPSRDKFEVSGEFKTLLESVDFDVNSILWVYKPYYKGVFERESWMP